MAALFRLGLFKRTLLILDRNKLLSYEVLCLIELKQVAVGNIDDCVVHIPQLTVVRVQSVILPVPKFRDGPQMLPNLGLEEFFQLVSIALGRFLACSNRAKQVVDRAFW